MIGIILRAKRIIFLLFVLNLCLTPIKAQNLKYKGQTSAWTSVNKNYLQTGFRFIPELSYNSRLSEIHNLSIETAGKATWTNMFEDFNHKENKTNLDLYRLWLRLSAAQYEFRVGLQKINFGSATLFRPLRWFDSIDPRDSLKLTDGVYGFLARYYFLNNTNAWFWALTGNDKLKGWEELPSNKRRVEYGGRLQFPVRFGEVGLSYHQRKLNVEENKITSLSSQKGDFTEQIIGIDGKWDVGIGIWLEGTLARQNYKKPDARYKSLLTIGTDYTFDVGNGLHILAEEFMAVESRNPFSRGNTQFMSGLSTGYPINVFDTCSAVVYYNQEHDDWYHYLAWQRTYDQWQIQISGFLNPERTPSAQSDTALNNLSGAGIQVMLVFNN